MSNRASIPDFDENLTSMAAALRAMKDVVEQLGGHRQGDSLGAPVTFVQVKDPSTNARNRLRRGDLWVKDATPVELHFWTGTMWRQLA